MAAKKKRLGKIRIKSLKRVILSSGLLIIAIIALLVVRYAVFSKDSEERAVQPYVIAEPSDDNINDNQSENANENTSENASDNTTNSENDDKSKNEISEVAVAANASLASHDEAMKEIGETIVKNKGINVNVVNCTTKSDLPEKVRAALEVNGFSVSVGKDKSLKRVNSVIIEKKDNVSGEDIKKLLNINRIKQELDPDSRFDIIVVIGDDYN